MIVIDQDTGIEYLVNQHNEKSLTNLYAWLQPTGKTYKKREGYSVMDNIGNCIQDSEVKKPLSLDYKYHWIGFLAPIEDIKQVDPLDNYYHAYNRDFADALNSNWMGLMEEMIRRLKILEGNK